MSISQAELSVTTEVSSDKAWSGYIRKAVLQFLKTAVVIDNEPGDNKADIKESLSISPPTDNGMDIEGYLATPPETLPESTNVLEIRKISDSFSEQGLACAFVLPEEGQDEEKVRRRVVLASRTADILVIDWHLRAGTSTLTLKLLREIAESDLEENGRMRLICIYTGEALDGHILAQAVEQLTVDGVDFSEAVKLGGFSYCARSQNSLLVLANKDEVSADALPLQLIDVFAELANGLVPAFAPRSRWRYQKNTHHMLTRFSQNLIRPI
nr:response regulator receiver domain [Pseudomonas syringae]UVN17907.1 hypothetical protein pPsy0479a_00075 [Pseudomonas syringae]